MTVLIDPLPQNDAFIVHKEEIAEIYQACFHGYPWFENLTREEVLSRIEEHIRMPGFSAFLAIGTAGQIVGALWYDELTMERLAAERGEALCLLASQISLATNVFHISWTRETLVRPEMQGQKIATRLRAVFLNYLQKQFPGGVLVLTRMRDDNFGIIKTAEKVGYKRTGIKVPSRKLNTQHEYWYKVVFPNN